MSSQVAERLEEARDRYQELRASLQIDSRLGRLKELEGRMARPDFWDNQERAQGVIQELQELKADVDPFEEAREGLTDLNELFQLAEMEDDEALMNSLGRDLDAIERKLDKLELRALFTHEHDAKPCFLSIQAGAGGTESCDWASMLLRMYARYIEQKGFKQQIVEINEGDEAGIKSATLKVKGPNAYGSLRAERGVHRLVRISPFDAQSRRHTSFVAVDVMPEFDEVEEVEISSGDLRVDTFRASGAGGQHVNKTDSAVRITHLPTGVVVSCQNERSQHANRRTAMSMLQSRLYQLEEAKREAELQQLYGDRGEIAWGNQIRSYVLQPYQMVKDHRTNHETGNTQAVLDGDIEPFIEAYLRMKAKEKAIEEREELRHG